MVKLAVFRLLPNLLQSTIVTLAASLESAIYSLYDIEEGCERPCDC